MANRLVKLTRVEYTPAVLAVAPRPGYTSTRPVRRATSSGRGGHHTTITIPPSPGAVSGNQISGQGSTLTYWNGGSGSTTYRTVHVSTYHPPVPGVPGVAATSQEHAVIGWDAGARSIASIEGDFRFEFQIGGGASGVLCGLAQLGSPVSEYNAIQYGFRVVSSRLEVVERGRTVAIIGPYDSRDTLAIQRKGGVVTYHTDAVVYTSGVSTASPVGIYACLYVSGDFVDNPTIYPILPLSADSDWGWGDHDTAVAVVARVPWGWSADAILSDGFVHVTAPVGVLAYDYAYGIVQVDAGGVGISANDNIRIDITGITHYIPTGLSAVGHSIGSGGAAIDPGGCIILSADYAYGEARMDVAPLDVFGVSYDEAPGTGLSSDFLGVLDGYSTDPVVFASLSDGLVVGSTVDLWLVLDAAVEEHLLLGARTDAAMLINALIRSGIRVSDNTRQTRKVASEYAEYLAYESDILQYTTNLATGAVGRYGGFDFLGFVKSGMVTFGWKADGLYRIGLAEDTGEKVQAMIDFAAEDFGTTHRKSVRGLFIGADTDGALYAKLSDDNDESTIYRAVPHGDTHRAHPAQRPTSRYWRMQLSIVDASVADIDNIEWIAATTGRRTRS